MSKIRVQQSSLRYNFKHMKTTTMSTSKNKLEHRTKSKIKDKNSKNDHNTLKYNGNRITLTVLFFSETDVHIHN